MLLAKTPTSEKSAEIISRSKHHAAKLIKDLDTGDLYYWPAEEKFHRQIAEKMSVDQYDKGIAVDESDTP